VRYAGLLTIPILFLTALGGKGDIVTGLRAGGDDYLAKPFDYDEMEARVEALIRRSAITKKILAKPEEMNAGNLRLNLTSRRAYLSGADIGLTPLEFSLAELLAKNRPRFVSPEEIYRAVWDAEPGDDIRQVKKHVHSIRSKLEENGESSVQIEQKRGAGYRICF